MTEDEMVGWHHWLNAHEFEQILGDTEGQEIWHAAAHGGRNLLDTTERMNNKQMREWTRLCSVKKLYDNREAIVSWPWGGRFCVTRSQHPLLHFSQAKMAPFHLNLRPSTQKPIWNFFFSRNQWVWSRNMSTRCCRNVYFSPHFSIVLLSLCQYKVLFHSAYLSQCPSGGKFTHRKFVFGSNGRDPQAKAAMSQSWTKLPREI